MDLFDTSIDVMSDDCDDCDDNATANDTSNQEHNKPGDTKCDDVVEAPSSSSPPPSNATTDAKDNIASTPKRQKTEEEPMHTAVTTTDPIPTTLVTGVPLEQYTTVYSPYITGAFHDHNRAKAFNQLQMQVGTPDDTIVYARLAASMQNMANACVANNLYGQIQYQQYQPMLVPGQMPQFQPMMNVAPPLPPSHPPYHPPLPPSHLPSYPPPRPMPYHPVPSASDVACDASVLHTLGERENEAKADHDKESIESFFTTITGGIYHDGKHIKGIVRKTTRDEGDVPGRSNMPFSHQMSAAKWSLKHRVNLLFHDPGMGKTATSLYSIGAHYIQNCSKEGSETFPKVLVTCPASCTFQWKAAIMDTIRVSSRDVIIIQSTKELTRWVVRHSKFIVISRDLVGRVYGHSHEWVKKHHQNDQGRWCSAWDAKPKVVPNPLLKEKFDHVIIDEVHFMRNRTAAWTKAHELISSNSKNIIALSATPVFNKPDDLIGISVALDLDEVFKHPENWFRDNAHQRIRVSTAKKFVQHTHRASESILNLPKITDVFKEFDPMIQKEDVVEYNEMLARAKAIITKFKTEDAKSTEALSELIALLNKMQQFQVAPSLGRHGAQAFHSSHELVKEAASKGSGCLKALMDQINELNEQGYNRVMVAVCHTSIIKVAESYLNMQGGVGSVYTYHGSMNARQRAKSTHLFLTGDKTVLLMSIQAGGTGLHLVPGCNAVVFGGRVRSSDAGVADRRGSIGSAKSSRWCVST